MVDFLKSILLSSEMYVICATALGILAAYIFDNYVNKPAVRRIAFEVAVAIENQTEEGTILDSFLDEFIKRFKVEKGRDPSAGELKTAFDINKKRISIKYNKEF